MSKKPILFNTDMVRGLLNGTKTVTRRVVKEPYYIDDEDVYRVSGFAVHRGTNMTHGMPYPDQPCSPGDILYVREKWRIVDYLDGLSLKFEYEADGKISDFVDFTNDRLKRFLKYISRKGWCPKIFMPREAARIFLRVRAVSVERLQDSLLKRGSTIFSLLWEGVDIGEQCRQCVDTYGNPCCIDGESECGALDDVRRELSDLWDSTIKPADRDLYGWAANPWVWVIYFERISREEAEL